MQKPSYPSNVIFITLCRFNCTELLSSWRQQVHFIVLVSTTAYVHSIYMINNDFIVIDALRRSASSVQSRTCDRRTLGASGHTLSCSLSSVRRSFCIIKCGGKLLALFLSLSGFEKNDVESGLDSFCTDSAT